MNDEQERNRGVEKHDQRALGRVHGAIFDCFHKLVHDTVDQEQTVGCQKNSRCSQQSSEGFQVG